MHTRLDNTPRIPSREPRVPAWWELVLMLIAVVLVAWR